VKKFKVQSSYKLIALLFFTFNILLLTFNITSAHLGGWTATLRANGDTPGIFNTGAGGTAVVSPMRDIQFIASIGGDDKGDIKYSFLCDRSANVPIMGEVSLADVNQTIYVDLSCKFASEGEYSPVITFDTPDGDVIATLAVLASFNPSKSQVAATTGSQNGTSDTTRDLVLGIVIAVLAVMVYKFAPDHQDGVRPPVGWPQGKS